MPGRFSTRSRSALLCAALLSLLIVPPHIPTSFARPLEQAPAPSCACPSPASSPSPAPSPSPPRSPSQPSSPPQQADPARPGGATSALWGTRGERFRVGGALTDWSYAGYMAGEAAIPAASDLRPTHDLARYLRGGDAASGGDPGDHDFSRAMDAALADMNDGDVLRVPAGTYTVRRQVEITKRVVILGAGSGRVTLNVPRGAAMTVRGGALFSDATRLTTVRDTGAKRGTNVIRLASTSGVRAGEWYGLTMGPPPAGGARFRDMNLGLDPGCEDAGFCNRNPRAFVHISRVAEVRGGGEVVLERPLPWDLFDAHGPKEFHAWRPRLQGVGIHGMSFVMQSARYRGHFQETGYDALELTGVANSWVRDVRVVDADFGIVVTRSAFVTVTNVTLDATDGRRMARTGFTGHHGLTAPDAVDILWRDFDVRSARYIHDLAVNKHSQGIVWSRGKGADVNMDHHRAQNHHILWTNLDLGEGRRAWNSGGRGDRGLHAGAYTTFWGIRASRALDTSDLDDDFGPGLVFVGLQDGTRLPSASASRVTRSWVTDEAGLDPDRFATPDLYEAQLRLRLAQPGRVAAALGGKGPGGKPLM